MIIGLYGFILAAAIALGVFALNKTVKPGAFARRTVTLLAVLGVLLGALCARLYYHAANNMVYGMGFEGYMPLSLYPYEYAMCGALLGVLLAAVLTAKMTRQSALRLLDALAPAALLALCVARVGEHFSDFGWGLAMENAGLQRFPFAAQDMFGQWHWAVYMLEAAFALILCLLVQRVRCGMPGDRFLTALLWWSASQILCESLRAETIRWGFVRVQQLQCAIFMLAVLIAFAVRAAHRGEKKKLPGAFAAFVLGVGVVVLMEYAIDKWDLAIALCYAIMTAALLVMGVSIQRVRPKLLPED